MATVTATPVPAPLGFILPNGVRKLKFVLADGDEGIYRIAEANRCTVQIASAAGATTTLQGTIDDATPTWVTIHTTAPTVTDLVKVDLHLMAIRVAASGGAAVVWITVEDML